MDGDPVAPSQVVGGGLGGERLVRFLADRLRGEWLRANLLPYAGAHLAASPGIFETVMSDGVRRAVVIRPDGSFVSPQNPARRQAAPEHSGQG